MRKTFLILLLLICQIIIVACRGYEKEIDENILTSGAVTFTNPVTATPSQISSQKAATVNTSTPLPVVSTEIVSPTSEIQPTLLYLETPTVSHTNTGDPYFPAMLISRSYNGENANGSSESPSISSDGDIIAFTSEASNLVHNDLNTVYDVFVRDVSANETELVSISNDSVQSLHDSGIIFEFGGFTAISADGNSIGFHSYAQDLLPSLSNQLKIFVYDRFTRSLDLIIDNDKANRWADFSSDGSIMVFASESEQLVPNDSNRSSDVFSYNFVTNSIDLVSKASSGEQGNGWSAWSSPPSISDDGRYIVFESASDNLSSEDTNNQSDIFLHDRETGQTQLISTGLNGNPANGRSESPQISGGGEYIVFTSYADNLVKDDANSVADIFLFALETAEITLISKGIGNQPANNASYTPQISYDGTRIAFSSIASNLTSDDNNRYADIFIFDSEDETIVLVSKSFDGFSTNNQSISPVLSADGKAVVFSSLASNLVPNDANGKWDIFLVKFR